MYSRLPKSYKRCFPFKIGTTSFIYPDDYVPNVKMLGPYLDEIELLFFESRSPGSIPSEHVITELAELAHEFQLSYNVHLPIDVSLSDPDPKRRLQAVESHLTMIERAAPLEVSHYVTHLPYGGGTYRPVDINKWQGTITASLDAILDAGLDSRNVCIETLNYPFHWLDKIIFDFDLSVCLDIGHLILNGYDVTEMFQTYSSRVTVMHVHGVAKKRDHLPLDRLPKEKCSHLMHILQKFSGTVSVEVFSFDYLVQSLGSLQSYLMEGNA